MTTTSRLEVLRSAYRTVLEADLEFDRLNSIHATKAEIDAAGAKLLSAQATYDEIRYNHD